MKFLLVVILIGVSIFLYIRYKSIVDPKLLEYKKAFIKSFIKYKHIFYEFLQAFTSWEAFKKMLYGDENLSDFIPPPVAPKPQRGRRRVRITPAKLNQETNNYDILHRKDEIETLKDYDKNDIHPKTFELALLLSSKEVKTRKTNKQNLILQKKPKPIKLDEPSAFIKSKSSVNSLNKDR